MPDASWNQTSFLGGEWSPFYQGRTDHPRYKTAMRLSLNGYPLEEGAWTRRTGTKFISSTRHGSLARIFPFNYNETLPYTLEFSPSALRIWNGDDLVLETPVDVVSISSANPAVLTVASDPGWASGDSIEILVITPGTTPALAGLVNRQFIVNRLTGTTYSLIDDADQTTTIDGLMDGNVWDGTTTAQAARVLTFTTPYVNVDWYDNRIIQFNNKAIILNQFRAPMVLQITNVDATAGRFASFSFTQIQFIDGPYYPPIDNQTVTTSGTSGTITLTFAGGFGPFATATPDAVGKSIRLFSEPPLWDASGSYSAGNVVAYGGVYWTAIASSTGAQPDISIADWQLNPTGAAWIWGTIVNYNSSTSVDVALFNGPLLYSTPIRTWRLGLFAGANLFPTCGCFHEGRLWLGISNIINASAPNDPFYMAPTVSDGTVTDASGISYTMEAGSEDANTIQWMNPDLNGITAGSFGGEYLIQASTLSDPITATSIQAKRVTKYGSANVEPVRTGLALVFVQTYRRRVLEMIADVFTGRYRAPDLAVTSRHLTEAQVEELAYQEELTPIIWLRLRDGSLKGVTYRRVSAYAGEEPMFVGWHQHTLGSGRAIVSIAISTIPVPVSGAI